MNIWVIGRGFPLPSNRMQGSFELEQAKMLARYGMNVNYLCCSFHPTRVIRKWGVQVWKEDNIEVDTYSIAFLPRIYPFYFNIKHTNVSTYLV